LIISCIISLLFAYFIIKTKHLCSLRVFFYASIILLCYNYSFLSLA